MLIRGASRRLLGALIPLFFLSACQAGRVVESAGARTPSRPETTSRPATTPSPCPLPAGDPLCLLNDAFRGAYADRRAAMLASSGPLIVLSGDDLVLFRDGERQEGRATNERYHALKSVAHVPFAVYLLLSGESGAIGDKRD